MQNCLFMDAARTFVRASEGCKGGIVLGNTFQWKANIDNAIGDKLQCGFNLEQAPKDEPGSLIIDDAVNEAPAFTTEGEWMVGKGGGDYAGVTHWAKKGTGEAKALFRPVLKEAGLYAVYAWYGGDPYNNHATDAPFIVRHKGGETEVRINLREGCSLWRLLGEFDFEAGTSGSVTLTNAANDNVMADAVKWVKK